MFQSVLVIFRFGCCAFFCFAVFFFLRLRDCAHVTSKQWQELNKLKALSRKLHFASPECHHSHSRKWNTLALCTHISYTIRTIETECVGLDHADDDARHLATFKWYNSNGIDDLIKFFYKENDHRNIESNKMTEWFTEPKYKNTNRFLEHFTFSPSIWKPFFVAFKWECVYMQVVSMIHGLFFFVDMHKYICH